MKIDLSFQFETLDEMRQVFHCLLQDFKIEAPDQDTPEPEKELLQRKVKIRTSKMNSDEEIQAWIDSQPDKFQAVEDALTDSKKSVIVAPVAVIKQDDAPKISVCSLPSCGKEFEKIKGQKFCSKKCSTKAKNQKYNAKQALKKEAAAAIIEQNYGKTNMVADPAPAAPVLMPALVESVLEPAIAPVQPIIEKKYDPDKLKQTLDNIKKRFQSREIALRLSIIFKTIHETLTPKKSNMETLKLDKAEAKKQFKSAPEWFRQVLISTFGAGTFSEKITDRLKTYEDFYNEADQVTREAATIYPTDLSNIVAEKKLILIIKVINFNEETGKQFIPSLADTNQKKWFPVFSLSSGSGFDFSGSYYYFTDTLTSAGLRLCFETKEKCEYVAKQFIDLYDQYINIK